MDKLKESSARSSAPALAERRTWGRWKMTSPFGLTIELGDDVVVGIDTIGLREEWPWRKQLVAKAPGVTAQDLKDLERARDALLAEGML